MKCVVCDDRGCEHCPKMTDVAADLATLDEHFDRPWFKSNRDTYPADTSKQNAAWKRMKAELARLTQERDDALSVTKSGLVTRLTERAEAAERALEYAEGVLSRDPFDDTQRRFAAEILRRALAASAPGAEGSPQEPYAPTAQEWADAHDPQEPQP